ncbi:MAG: ethanolamine ammonia-lyase reactivating factor EutA [Chloroflexi bacterium]|nr:ethanolamine ammonia-lyase reactivating factor EutA [Chloroflexota bacterium]
MHAHSHGNGHEHSPATGQFHDHGEDDDFGDEDVELDDTYLLSGDHIELTTVGIDIGSSTSHLMFSRLKLRRLGQNLSSRYVIVSREALFRSPILLTPYTPDYAINASVLSTFVEEAYQAAGLKREDVDTGAIILTGEAVKRSNAQAIAELFASESGKFVCATAGHNLEAVMAAHGSGAAALSREIEGAVLNVDVGGGTSKLALCIDGQVVETSSLAVGGRLIAVDEAGRVVRIEPSAREVADAIGLDPHLNQVLAEPDQRAIAEKLADCLMEAVRRVPLSPLAASLMVTPILTRTDPIDLVTFSGGVSEYIYARETESFGDLSLHLSAAIRARIDGGQLPAPLRESGEHIRATVIGASQFTVQVSGNTVSISNTEILPIHNLQVLYPQLPAKDPLTPGDIRQAVQESFTRFDLEEGAQPVALALDWNGTPTYSRLRALADGVALSLPKTIAAGMPVVLVFHYDFGALVGRILREEIGLTNDVISIDSVTVKDFDYIDIGNVIMPSRAVPVVIKSLVFPHSHDPRAELAE